jgi:hypothetical protein
MKTRRLTVTLFVVALAFAPQLSTASAAEPEAAQGGFRTKLISPTAGQVFFPAQRVRVEWKSTLPDIDPSWV